MRETLNQHEQAWARDRVARLERMIEALDDDLPLLEDCGAWRGFWEDMRRLYLRTAMSLRTAATTDDRVCFIAGTAQWEEIEDLIRRAGQDLGASSSRS